MVAHNIRRAAAVVGLCFFAKHALPGAGYRTLCSDIINILLFSTLLFQNVSNMVVPADVLCFPNPLAGVVLDSVYYYTAFYYWGTRYSGTHTAAVLCCL